MIQKVFFFILLTFSFESFSFQKTHATYSDILEILDSLFKNEKYQEIISNHQDFFQLFSQKDSLQVSKIYHIIAKSNYQLENFEKAILYHNLAISIAPNSEEGKKIKGSALYDKSYVEYDLGEFVLSYKTVKKAAYILSNLSKPDYEQLLTVYIDLGSEASYQGFYEEGKFYLSKGLEIFQKKLHEKETVLKDKATKKVLFQYKFCYLYSLIGDKKNALFHLQELEKIRKLYRFNAIENLMYAASLNSIGDMYLNFREKFSEEKALKLGAFYLDKSLKKLDQKQFPDNFIQFQFNVAKQLRYQKKFKEALELNSQILKIAGENDERYPFFMAQKGLIYLENNQLSKAMQSFDKMIAFIHSDSAQINKNFTNFKPSNELNHTGLLVEIGDEILKKYPKDSLILKKVNTFYKLGLIQLKNCYKDANFNKKIKDYYHKAIKGLLNSEPNSKNEQFLVDIISDIENIENRFAWKEFTQNRVAINSSLPDSIVNKEAIIRSQIVAASKNNDTLKINELKYQLEKHFQTIEYSYPNISKFIYKEFVLKDLQKKLSNKTTVLRYKIIDNIIYVFKITNHQVSLQKIEFTSEIKNSITAYIRAIKERNSIEQLSTKLIDLLIPFPLENSENLIIIPDNILHQLPFETLRKNNHYLIENHTINYASFLIFINQDKISTGKLKDIYISAPISNAVSSEKTNQTLVGAAKEAMAIASLFKNEVVLNQPATKNDFLKNAPISKLIHLATHAKIDNEKPALSYFSFHDSSNVQGKLYLEELYGMQLQADLAVLSACNTGTANFDNNFGAVSLQRAFTLAGVPATISSLWDVPDAATSEIMVAFYTHLKAGKSKAEALREAKLQYLKTTKNNQLLAPYYWAGFILSGDNSTIFQKNETNLVWIGVIVAVMLMFYIFKRFQKR